MQTGGRESGCDKAVVRGDWIMLAILFIEVDWLKENRTPGGAIQRQKYYKPVKIEDEIKLVGEDIFYKKCSYHQRGDSVYSDMDAVDRANKELYEKGKGKAFTGSEEEAHRWAKIKMMNTYKDKGAFYKLENIDIPCVTIKEEMESCYRVIWSDQEHGMPRRRGGNEDLYINGSKLVGQPNRLNETAFVLQEGQSGVLKYNYRYTSYHGQWYKCYYVYIVNGKTLTKDIFLREYDYEYDQLADLF